MSAQLKKVIRHAYCRPRQDFLPNANQLLFHLSTGGYVLLARAEGVVVGFWQGVAVEFSVGGAGQGRELDEVVGQQVVGEQAG
ncbi:hypothetical protein, partial [Hymenobacter sp. CRA2]|uniref:hypothetical protein n=1 Tax=Hymenobacter sp. CRA2 TaxID=1955620 RepID=UPI001C37C025